jgi:hypothetical protein
MVPRIQARRIKMRWETWGSSSHQHGEVFHLEAFMFM